MNVPTAPVLTGSVPINPPCAPVQRWPVHDVAASRRWELQALAHHEPHALMARAGLAVARWALAHAPHAQCVEVLVGPGNNGGDGLVAARHLHAAGKQVRVVMPAVEARGSGAGARPNDANSPTDRGWALAEAQQAGVSIVVDHRLDPQAELVIDALLGLGSTRAPTGALALAIVATRAGPAPVFAVDLPSGLDANTGALLGTEAVQAQATLSLLTLKPGCFTAQGRDHAGQVWLDCLGLVTAPAPSAWIGAQALPNLRRHSSHKGSHGDVTIVGGAHGMQGAATLAARAALAAGAGRVFVSPLAGKPSAADANGDPLEPQAIDPMHAELMWRPSWWRSSPAVIQATTVVCGCGGGEAIASALPALLAHAPRLVLDADALNQIAADTNLAKLLRARAGRELHTVITPHPLEAARLLACTTAQVQRDRLSAAAELVERFQVVAVLKGSGTVVASLHQPPTINASGNGALASPGTGDVLAGWLGGLWAQLPTTLVAAVAIEAVRRHGHAADIHARQFPGTPLRASNLIQAMLEC